MARKNPLKVGALAFCECPEGVGKLPHGLPRGALVEVAATHGDTTHVKYYSRTFAVPTAWVHLQSDPQAKLDSQTGRWTRHSFGE